MEKKIRSFSQLILLPIFLFSSLGASAQDSQQFSLEDLYNQAKEKGSAYLKFIDNDKLSSGIYQLKKGSTDQQRPHDWDELYYVLEGRATLKVEDQSYEVKPGEILFVAAQIEHTFVDIREDLKVLVFFSKKE